LVTEEHGNYLIKMKTDTMHFGDGPMGKLFNFFPTGQRKIDPFLINASLSNQQHAVGGGIRGLRNRGNNSQVKSDKILLPIPEHLIKKANAC
jgi:hypothetical protein